MTTQPQEIGSRKSPAARLPIDFAVVLSRTIESIKHDPAQLRNAVYELAHIKLQTEVCARYPAIEVRRLMLALECAIEGVETIYSKQDDLGALPSLHSLIESSEIGRSEARIKPREPLLTIEHPAAQTTHANHRSKRASFNVERLLYWPRTASPIRTAMVIIFAVALCAVLSQFGQTRPQAAVSSASQPVGQHQPALRSTTQTESAPTPSAIAQIQDAPANLSPRRFVDAGAPTVMRNEAPSSSGRHDPQTAAPEEQSAKPQGSNCRQTYKVPSESGGQVSISVVRC